MAFEVLRPAHGEPIYNFDTYMSARGRRSKEERLGSIGDGHSENWKAQVGPILGGFGFFCPYYS